MLDLEIDRVFEEVRRVGAIGAGAIDEPMVGIRSDFKLRPARDVSLSVNTKPSPMFVACNTARQKKDPRRLKRGS
ncbi:hypothetical protein BH11MYX2_BH11MYX2_13160 [soil metagenome]